MSHANTIAIKRRILNRENAMRPKVLTEIPRSEWPTVARMTLPPSRAWRSRDILVQMYEEPTGGVRLTISSTTMLASGDWREGLSWEELQRIKSEIGFADRWAVELFPPDADVVNVANMRHLWLLPEPPSYGWQREVSPSPGAVPEKSLSAPLPDTPRE